MILNKTISTIHYYNDTLVVGVFLEYPIKNFILEREVPAYNTNNVNVNIDRNSQNVSNAIVVAMYKERRERLRDERRGSWLSDIIKKHDTK